MNKIKITSYSFLQSIDHLEVLSFEDLYICDLMSFVLGHVKKENVLLLTIINSLSVIAVASLLNLSGIIFCEGVIPTEEMIKKAKEEGIPLFTSRINTFETAIKIHESLL